MKNYKKGILALAILSTMSLMAAEDKTIYVTTFDDEDGENVEKCSLREAVTAASMHKAYGGCPVGQVDASMTNVIQLEEGEYKLTRELQPNSSLSILGKLPANYRKADVLTNTFPAVTALKTTISGQGKSRIFNTTNLKKPALNLTNIILKDGYSSDTGGALYLGSTSVLTNVQILNSKAKSGGAIFLNDIDTGLTINRGIIQGNDATEGSVLAMTCNDNLVYTNRTINITGVSILGNGSSSSLSTMTFCGQPTAIFTANTITNNIANAQSGRIFQFSSKTPEKSINLSPSASLALVNNTIVKNNAFSTLLYNSRGIKSVQYNILAFNEGGKSCRYADGDVTEVKGSNFLNIYNAVKLASDNDQCETAKELLTDEVKKTLVDVSDVNPDTVLSTLQTPTEYTAFMPMYFLKNLNTDKDLVDIGSTGCAGTDQRGMTRILNRDTTDTSCDLGSTEILSLTATDLATINTSVVPIINNYQKEYDTFKGLIDNKETNPEYLPYYNIMMNNYNTLLNNTKSDQKYRTLFIDPFALNLPDEAVRADGGREIKHLTTENYDVTVESLGTGKLDEKKQFVGRIDPALRCEWNKELKQVLMYRTDDFITATGDNEFCKYTLTMKGSNPVKSSSAYIVANFINIAPIAKDANFNIQHGTDQKIDINLLDQTNDDGDGLVSQLSNNPNKSRYYLNAAGQDLAIRISSLPDPVAVTAERSGPCPGNDKKLTCLGGKITVQIKNTLDPFDYKFNYMVYDADGLVSNTATVTLSNSASTPSARSGGGATGILGLLGLFSLIGLRRFYSLKKSRVNFFHN